jgi:hypothetical protein
MCLLVLLELWICEFYSRYFSGVLRYVEKRQIVGKLRYYFNFAVHFVLLIKVNFGGKKNGIYETKCKSHEQHN